MINTLSPWGLSYNTDLLQHVACGILVPDQDSDLHSLIRRWILNHWTITEVLALLFFLLSDWE